MSYDFDPEWADMQLPPREQMACPACGQVAGNYDTVIARVLGGGYYEPRHIPPQLVFTCDNPDCPDVDNDYTVKLRVVVEVI